MLRAANRPPLISLAALGAVGLIGCGGDGPEPLSAEELVSRGDRICREGQARFGEIQVEPPVNSAEAVAQTEELIGVAEGELDELDGLRPPEELRATYDEYLEARERAIDLMERGRDAAEGQDAKGYGAAQSEVAAEQGERMKLAQELGFEVCSQPNP